jgi:hypothetical protein
VSLIPLDQPVSPKAGKHIGMIFCGELGGGLGGNIYLLLANVHHFSIRPCYIFKYISKYAKHNCINCWNTVWSGLIILKLASLNYKGCCPDLES